MPLMKRKSTSAADQETTKHEYNKRAAFSEWRQKAQELLEQGAEPLLAFARMIGQHLILHSPPRSIIDIKATATARTVTLRLRTAGDRQWLLPMVFDLTKSEEVTLEFNPNFPERLTLRLKVSPSQIGWPSRERRSRAKEPSIGWRRAPGCYGTSPRRCPTLAHMPVHYYVHHPLT